MLFPFSCLLLLAIAVRMTMMPAVSEGGPCEDPSVGGPCAAIPADVAKCCGVNATVSDCLSMSCCPSAPETEDAASQDR